MKVINTWLIVSENGFTNTINETENGKWFSVIDTFNTPYTEITEEEAKKIIEEGNQKPAISM